MTPSATPRRRRWPRRLALAVALFVALPAGLFALNGLVLAARQTPVLRHFDGVDVAPSASGPGEVTLLAYNIAKAFVNPRGYQFSSREFVEGKLHGMAAVIRAERPDIVFLSEAVTECAPCNVDQVESLARACGLPFAATGEDYNVGVPGCRVVGGNAVLSRTPLTAVANPDLVGRRPFWVTRNNRRALVVSAPIGGRDVWLLSLHNDSFSLRNNEAQVRQLVDLVGDRPAVWGGDFNAQPHQPPIGLLKAGGRYVGAWDGPPTYIDGDRKERLDFVLAPAAWEHVETRVVADDTSDHRPVVSRFRVEKR